MSLPKINLLYYFNLLIELDYTITNFPSTTVTESLRSPLIYKDVTWTRKIVNSSFTFVSYPDTQTGYSCEHLIMAEKMYIKQVLWKRETSEIEKLKSIQDSRRPPNLEEIPPVLNGVEFQFQLSHPPPLFQNHLL